MKTVSKWIKKLSEWMKELSEWIKTLSEWATISQFDHDHHKVVKSGDWHQLLGHYLLKGKRRLITYLDQWIIDEDDL